MEYTVKQLATIAGISVRTLHYYDGIGLLQPSFLKANGYRCYRESELLKLQQILFFRELEFSLEEITKIVHTKDFNALEALTEHKKLLQLRQKRINGLLDTVDTTIAALKGGKNMKTDDMFASFSDVQMEKYKTEAKKRWGNTEAYKQSQERTRNWTKADYKRVAEEGKAFTQKLAAVMDKDVKSPEVQTLIDQHHAGIEIFYDCPPEMYRVLGQMYVQDKRFMEYYDGFKPGLAKFVAEAIAYYCDVRGNT